MPCAVVVNRQSSVKAVASALKVRPDEAAERVQALVEERRKLERDLADALMLTITERNRNGRV